MVAVSTVVPVPTCSRLPAPVMGAASVTSVVVSRLMRKLPLSTTLPLPSEPVLPPLPTTSVLPLAMVVVPW